MPSSDPKFVYRILLLATATILGLGTVFYYYVEDLKWIDSYYFSVVTLATVGYGDFVPKTTFGKIFTTFYIFVGVGIVTTFISFSIKRGAERREEKREKANKNN